MHCYVSGNSVGRQTAALRYTDKAQDAQSEAERANKQSNAVPSPPAYGISSQNSLLTCLPRIRESLVADHRGETETDFKKILQERPHGRDEACLLRPQEDSHRPYDRKTEAERQPSRWSVVQDHKVGLQLESQAHGLALSATE
jgi:hypothetical protein